MRAKSKKALILTGVSVVLLTVTSCGKEDYIEDTDLRFGAYYPEEDIFLGPALQLYPDGEGSFTYASASSDMPVGPFEVRNDTIVLTDDLDGREFTFKIDGDRLIYLAEESAEVWDYGEFQAEDGMVFVYNEELSDHYLK